ncbi:MAG: DinB family protein [Oleiphilaceae bacterium]|nr:DinB family protein [Oleiphilaceae bacterium]
MPNQFSGENEGDLVAENLEAIAQLSALLLRLPDPLYRQCFGVKKQHVIGKHVRHIIDHYTAFLTAIFEQPQKPLNYENRQRAISLETDAQTAHRRLLALSESVSQLSPVDGSTSLTMKHATGETVNHLPTSIGRELAFLASHTIHHMAIIGMLAEQSGIEVDAAFGVHPSTLRHHRALRDSLAENA